MTATVYDATPCALGEGALWHPERGELFWFDILGNRLLSRARTWTFDEHVSAAGWIDRDTLLIAAETALFAFDLSDGTRRNLCALEADIARTRSNDGRADPWGGFWIGTMGKRAEPGAGAIYRYARGELRRLFGGITISNAISFTPDRRAAYYTDTREGQILRVALDEEGWPRGAPEVFVDARGAAWGPDGAVVDAEGCLWNAQWGAGRVARYSPDGALLATVEVPTPHTTCPAFGGAGLTTLFVTTAISGAKPPAGQTFTADVGIKGQAEHRVLL
ncbi:MAG: SMP-30/gluconolactonase/LRE family protein [Pseudomonadota bacterium]